MKRPKAKARKATARGGSAAAAQGKVKEAPDGGPNVANAKTRQQKTATKGNRPKRRAKTGAPALFPDIHSFIAAGDVRGLWSLVRESRNERQRFRDLATREVTKQIWWALLELAERTIYPRLTRHGDLENAAEDLAAVATAAAKFLEDFACSDPFSDGRLNIELAARRKNYWPVLLRLGAKQKGKDRQQTTLEGWDKAKAYLSDIHLGQDAPAELRFIYDRHATPFRRAAAVLLYSLRKWREHGLWHQFARDGKITPWAKRLCSLGDEMTPENAEEWWSVAKIWVDEQWEANRDWFKPLIRLLNLDNENKMPSLVKRRVVDDSLKKAFKSLADDRLKAAFLDPATPSGL